MITNRRLLEALGIVLVACTVPACSTANDDAGPPSHLSADAVVGWRIASENGCMSCHGQDGSGGLGPRWVGLAGSVRTLDDGTEAVADREYLETALRDPRAQQVAGFTLTMPTARLTDAEIAAIVDYLEEL